ncbi:hypothetical protein MCOR27_006340 [Pyricularia oryzae]|uniref:Uncharacterized protein n=5 Tax=Pyricularia TaxID=48558 RepID=A0ABQ8P098_PYRGI|nr:uncharacterized protein MGG_17440 [Pyricularia oryzae 70-15]ELQ38856.1 hypothetical protein OOU_Y34scaffold00522g11 [Pyricularia oryzae Y34]KAH8840908.1 hypothetical protein MCOR01_007588 [Pyricularia oryzae]KAI6304625.1 hypothetical protein MCOR33_000474 [Pyricularia grisea]EHA48958.1 hypothetical protein MGG_17440 [Pyricularia oryzae 70-15]KAH9433772.1 hypothetical protein MCOR02_005812 [Pyricularia oryzae]
MAGMFSHGTGESERHAASMNRSAVELERMIKGHEESLHRILQSSGTAAAVVPSAVGSFEIMITAYQDVTASSPILPSRDSLLPALLATRRTHRTAAESRAFLEAQEAAVERARRKLEAEESGLEDQRILRKCLEERIQSLHGELESRTEPTPQEISHARIQELRLKKRTYDRETSALLRTFNKFIDEHLAPLLAAEELGGPVVGEMMDIDSDGLVAGFSSHGKPKKVSGAADPEKRQQRIDEIWGSPSARPGSKTGQNWDETAAAASDMRELTEQLLQKLVESEGDHWASYVHIPKESAAARFLIRSRVAQFHPKDATRLRLIDFGKDLDD